MGREARANGSAPRNDVDEGSRGSKIVLLVRVLTVEQLTDSERDSLVNVTVDFLQNTLRHGRINGRVEVAEIAGEITIVGAEGGVRV